MGNVRSNRKKNRISAGDAARLRRKALNSARTILAKPSIEPDEFRSVIAFLDQMADLRDWKERVENAYKGQTAKTQKALRSEMLRYYFAVKDWENAMRLLTAGNLKNAVHAVFVMGLLIENKRIKEAKSLAGRCERDLDVEPDGFIISMLTEALAVYHARLGLWNKALDLWRKAPLDQPFRRNALSGIVRIHLEQALDASRHGLDSLAAMRRRPEYKPSLDFPGNDEAMTLAAEKELMSLKKGIEKLIQKRV